jgi:hypothetical protein
VLEHIPTVTIDDLDSFIEQELTEIESNARELLAELDKTNPNLAKAIKTVAQATTKKTFVDNYWKQKVEAKFIHVILVITKIINQAFEAKGKEEHTLTS